MRRLAAVSALVGLALPLAALAQNQNPLALVPPLPPPAPPFQKSVEHLGEEWNAVKLQMNHLGDQINAYVRETIAAQEQAGAKLSATEAYWRAWCGPVPGCAVGSVAKP